MGLIRGEKDAASNSCRGFHELVLPLSSDIHTPASLSALLWYAVGGKETASGLLCGRYKLLKLLKYRRVPIQDAFVNVSLLVPKNAQDTDKMDEATRDRLTRIFDRCSEIYHLHINYSSDANPTLLKVARSLLGDVSNRYLSIVRRYACLDRSDL